MIDTFLRLEHDGRWLVRVDGHDLGTYRTAEIACLVLIDALSRTPDELRALMHEMA